MNRATQAFLIVGVAAGAIAALGAAEAFEGGLWVEVAGASAAFLAAALLLALELRLPPAAPAPPTPPRRVDLMREAAGGDRLARESVLEELDRLAVTNGRGRPRLARDPRLYAVSRSEFLAIVERIVADEERRP